MLDWIIFFAICFGYMLMGLIAGVVFYRMEVDSMMPELTSSFVGIFWPIGWWVILAVWTVRALEDRDDRIKAAVAAAEKKRKADEELLRREGIQIPRVDA